MVRYFKQFLEQSFSLTSEDFSLRLNLYLNKGVSLRDVEDLWLSELSLPRSSLRGHTINHFPTSTSGRKPNKLPNGVAFLYVRRSTRIVQHIYGAVQEYAGFDEPRWLDCDPVRQA